MAPKKSKKCASKVKTGKRHNVKTSGKKKSKKPNSAGTKHVEVINVGNAKENNEETSAANGNDFKTHSTRRSNIKSTNSERNRSLQMTLAQPITKGTSTRKVKKQDSIVSTVAAPSYIDRTIKDLPTEMLTSVFKHLPVHDRKNVRLVCKMWYDACNVQSILNSEVLVCPGIHGLTSIVKTLLKSKRKTFNIIFHRIPDIEFPLFFWEKCGDKILWLKFFECAPSDDTFKRVTMFCDNMWHLGWIFESYCEDSMALCSVETINYFLTKQILRKSLISLEMMDFHPNKLFTDHIMKGIFTIYPNIKRLEFFRPFTYLFTNSRTDPGRRDNILAVLLSVVNQTDYNMEPFPSILHKLSFSAKDMEFVAFDDLVWRDWETRGWSAILEIPNFTRLKKVSFSLDDPVVATTIKRFLVKQKFLQKVRCYASLNNAQKFTYDFMTELIDKCPHLSSLKLSVEFIFMDIQLFRSDRESFSIVDRCMEQNNDAGSVHPVIDFLNKLPRHHNLLKLKLHYYDYDPSFSDEDLILLLQTYPNMIFLELGADFVTNRVLQAIWNYQVNLKHLILECRGYCSNKGFIGSKHASESQFSSIRKLEKLEILDLRLKNGSKITDKIFSEFVFPRLRSITLTAPRNSIFPTLYESLKRLNELEAVSFKRIEITGQKWIELCPHFKKLRFITIRNQDIFEENIYTKIMERCPYLRSLDHLNDDGDSACFYNMNSNRKKNMTKLDLTEYTATPEKLIKLSKFFST